MKIGRLIRFSASLLAMLTNSSVYGDECSALLKYGIYDIRTKNVTSDTARSFANWYCDQSFTSSQSAHNTGMDLGIPVDDIPVKFGFQEGSSNWNQWYHSFCQDVKENFSQKVALTDYVSSIHDGVLKAFNVCVNSPGLHVWIEQHSNPKEFAFAAKFVTPTAPISTATIKEFIIDKSITCTPSPTKRKVGPEEFRSRCTRNEVTDEHTLIVNATFTPVGGDTLVVKGFPKPEPITASSVAQRIENGDPFIVWFDGLTHYFGSIIPGEQYSGYYVKAIKTWYASGRHDDTSPQHNVTYAKDVAYGYGRGSPGNLTTPLEPKNNTVCIWGWSDQFNQKGEILEGGKVIAHILFATPQ